MLVPLLCVCVPNKNDSHHYGTSGGNAGCAVPNRQARAETEEELVADMIALFDELNVEAAHTPGNSCEPKHILSAD